MKQSKLNNVIQGWHLNLIYKNILKNEVRMAVIESYINNLIDTSYNITFKEKLDEGMAVLATVTSTSGQSNKTRQ